MTDARAREILEIISEGLGDPEGFTVEVTKHLAGRGIEAVREEELLQISDRIKNEYTAKAKERPAGDNGFLELFVKYMD